MKKLSLLVLVCFMVFLVLLLVGCGQQESQIDTKGWIKEKGLSQIAFKLVGESTEENEVWIMDADGGNRKNLTNSPEREYELTMSHDGQKIAYTVSTYGKDNKIFIMNKDGTGKTLLANDLYFINVRPRFSSNDSKLVYASNQAINIIELLTLAKTTISCESTPIYVSWSPDDSKILFYEYSTSLQKFGWFVVGADNSNKRPIYLHEDYHLMGGFAAWLPSGDNLLITSRTLTNESYSDQFFTVKSDGSNLKQITNDKSHKEELAISPDGSKIFFWFSDGNYGSGTMGIYSINIDGSNRKQIIKLERAIFDLAISEDGETLMYSTDNKSGNTKIYLIKTDGSSNVGISDDALPRNEISARWPGK